MAYKRKTRDFWGLYFDYGYGDGLELISDNVTFAEARRTRQDYIENEHICPIIKKHREPIKEGVS